MNAKTTAAALGLIVSAGLFLCALTYAVQICAPSLHRYETQESASEFQPSVPVFQHPPAPVSSSSAVEPTALYKVCLVEDGVRLMTAGREDDYRILTAINPRTLRQSDRLMLEQGIWLFSQGELQKFLEDFSS